jgi:hypothetical protein
MQYGHGTTANTKLQQATTQLLRINCLHHPQDKITNFCKSYQCLLPMCPKCVKIHSEEHARIGITYFSFIGTHGDFDTIEDCLELADRTLLESIKTAQIVAQKTQDARDNCRQQSLKLRKEFNNHKEKIIS